MAPAMKSAMKKAGASGLTTSQAFAKIAESIELKLKTVKAVVTNYMELAAAELKKNGKFKVGGVLWKHVAAISSGGHVMGAAPDSNAGLQARPMPKLEKVEITVMDHEMVKAETSDHEGARSSVMKPCS